MRKDVSFSLRHMQRIMEQIGLALDLHFSGASTSNPTVEQSLTPNIEPQAEIQSITPPVMADISVEESLNVRRLPLRLNDPLKNGGLGGRHNFSPDLLRHCDNSQRLDLSLERPRE
ncbi:hypothetical protein [Pseudomonas citri]|uniref:hypothetical protein n=1 Tax=Pseudomonas citri TaxID=2978349 RepID=UPI0021B53635|nr:hypothetical protein [Pseudomonas citri]